MFPFQIWQEIQFFFQFLYKTQQYRCLWSMDSPGPQQPIFYSNTPKGHQEDPCVLSTIWRKIENFPTSFQNPTMCLQAGGGLISAVSIDPLSPQQLRFNIFEFTHTYQGSSMRVLVLHFKFGGKFKIFQLLSKT